MGGYFHGGQNVRTFSGQAGSLSHYGRGELLNGFGALLVLGHNFHDNSYASGRGRRFAP